MNDRQFQFLVGHNSWTTITPDIPISIGLDVQKGGTIVNRTQFEFTWRELQEALMDYQQKKLALAMGEID